MSTEAQNIRADGLWKLFKEIYSDRNRRAEAFKVCREAAELGHIEAQRKMSEFYFSGLQEDDGKLVVSINLKKAREWIKKAAEQGDERSMAQYAWDCCIGEYKRDLNEAIEWARAMTGRNFYEGYAILYRSYYEMGEHLKAFHAAEAGAMRDVKSMEALAEAYEKGIGCEIDNEKAREWWEKAEKVWRERGEESLAEEKRAKQLTNWEDEVFEKFGNGQVSEILKQIANHAERAKKHRFGIFLYTDCWADVNFFANLLSDKIYSSAEGGRKNPGITKVPATEFLLGDAGKLNKLYEDNRRNIVIYDFDSVNTMKEPRDRVALVNRMLWNIKKSENTFNVISGDKKALSTLLGNKKHFASFSDTYFYEVDFDDWDKERICDYVWQILDMGEGNEQGKDDLRDYIGEYYDRSALNNRDYAWWLVKSIFRKQCDGAMEGKKGWTKDLLPAPITLEGGGESALAKMDELVGLHSFKRQIDDLTAFLEFNNKLGNVINKGNFNLHMIFTGNPGTGKTMCARMVTELFYEMGYIKQNKFTEVEGKDLIGEYLGQTAPKTDQVIKGALDGVLFIDEAYSTAGHRSVSGISYSQDFISTLLKSMEDYRDRLIIIFGGYREEMEGFMKSNPGLQSRIGYNIDFEDYTVEELYEILHEKFDEMGFSVEDGVRERAMEIIEKASKIKNFGNARFAINFLQYIIIAHARNVRGSEDEEVLRRITVEDINGEILENLGKEKVFGFAE